MMDKKARIWIERNNLDLILNNNNPWEIISGPTKDKKKYYNYLQKQSLEIIFKNPFISIQHVFKQSMHMLVLDPVYIKYLYQFDSRGKNKYYKSDTHKKWIPIRIIYSVIIYFVIFFGMIYSLKNMRKEIIFLLVVSTAYFVLTLGWMGISRYFVPALIFLSIFFGNGMATILNYNKLNKIKWSG